MKNSRIKTAGLLILVLSLGLLFVSACTSVPDDGVQDSTINGAALQGNIFDGNTGAPLANTNLKININYLSGGRWKQVFTDTQKTDVMGNYLVKTGELSQLEPNFYIEYVLEKDGYVASWYRHLIKDKTPLLNLNFGMIKSDGEITVSGQVMNVTDRTPIPDAKINLQLVDQGNREKQSKPKTVTYVADKDGNYQAKIPTSYMTYAFDRKGYFRINPDMEGFELASSEGRVNGKSENDINFTTWKSDFYLVDAKQEGVLKGTSLDKSGNPMANIPVVVKFGQRKG